jgi:hypothetical protein
LFLFSEQDLVRKGIRDNRINPQGLLRKAERMARRRTHWLGKQTGMGVGSRIIFLGALI